jgi:hypothetical protein
MIATSFILTHSIKYSHLISSHHLCFEASDLQTVSPDSYSPHFFLHLLLFQIPLHVVSLQAEPIPLHLELRHSAVVLSASRLSDSLDGLVGLLEGRLVQSAAVSQQLADLALEGVVQGEVIDHVLGLLELHEPAETSQTSPNFTL